MVKGKIEEVGVFKSKRRRECLIRRSEWLIERLDDKKSDFEFDNMEVVLLSSCVECKSFLKITYCCRCFFKGVFV